MNIQRPMGILKPPTPPKEVDEGPGMVELFFWLFFLVVLFFVSIWS